MLDLAAQERIPTVWDRYATQEPQCGFGLLGVCCRNCMQGPCRIYPFEPSVLNVFAAGDVVETNDVVTGESVASGIWTNAVAMGHVAGENVAGGAREYAGAFSLLNAMDMAGIPVVSVGVIQPPRRGYEAHVSRNGAAYRKLVFRDRALVGALLVGEIEKAGLYTALIREHADVSAVKAAMLDKTFSYAHRLRSQMQTT